MIYPNNFEQKIGFDEIRQLLKDRCLSPMGKERIDSLRFSTDVKSIRQWLEQIKEFRRIINSGEEFPTQFYYDVRAGVSRLRLEGTHLDEGELFDLRRLLDTVGQVVRYLSRTEGGSEGDADNTAYLYPSLHKLTTGIRPFTALVARIDRILDKYGKIRDNASAALFDIRQQLAKTEGSISRILGSILKAAQQDGLVVKDASPTVRDGRLVLPVAPAMKRKIKGIVHDESATGRTVFIEPTEVVEANNRIRELEAEERREIIRILTEISSEIRPYTADIMSTVQLLSIIDVIRSKTLFAELTGSVEPSLSERPLIDWRQARHPLLQLSLAKQGKKVVPLDITLTDQARILIISGPNAGGKSVCLKTVGLL